MKTRLQRFIILFVFSLLSNLSFSSTIKWVVRPNYDRIEIYCNNVYKCYLDGKIQLFNSSGVPLLPNPCDSVTDFSEGYALVLEKGLDESKWIIKGYFTEEDLKYKEIPQGYYTMLYSFFSDGLLAVGNEKNLYGYLNTQGLEVIPCQYYKARPFLHGWASVQTDNHQNIYKNHVIYINKSARPLTVRFHHGEVNDGTSFNQNGEAVVIHYKSRDMAVINTSGELVRPYKKPDNLEKFYRNYDRAFSEDGKELTPPNNKTPQYDTSITTIEKDNRFGYRFTNSTIIPEQFTYAGPFANRCAIVSANDRYGIVSMIDGSVSSYIKEEGDIVFESGKKNPKLTYIVDIPKEITSFQVNLDQGDGIMTPVELTDNGFVFTPKVKKSSKTCIINAEVWSDGILLLSNTFIKGVQSDPVRLTVTKPVATTERANHKDIQTIESSITNNASTSFQITVTFTTSFSANSANSLVNSRSEGVIAPGETMNFYASVSVKESETIKVTVTVNANNKKTVSSTSTVKLLPYF